MTKRLALDPFALRQFDALKPHSHIPFPPDAFLTQVNQLYASLQEQQECPLKEGYAPFCKHLFIPNFTNATNYYTALSPSNRHLLRTEYVSRRPEELAVLSRWFPRESVEPSKAEYLDLILYSKEQIRKENKAMGEPITEMDKDQEWGIISIKPQNLGHEIPMEPITMMRNALPIEEGGSGTPLDRQAYSASVSFWKDHVVIQ